MILLKLTRNEPKPEHSHPGHLSVLIGDPEDRCITFVALAPKQFLHPPSVVGVEAPRCFVE